YSAQWTTGSILAGPPNESSQTVHFIVTIAPADASHFIVPPSISSTGILSFTPALGPASTTTVTVQLMDDGGTAIGGVDRSPQQTFLIQQTAVDLAPTITLPGTQRLIKNTPLLISTGEFNSIVVADADAFS